MRSTAALHAFVLTAFVGSLLGLPSQSWAQPTFSEQGATILAGANFNSRSASMADYDGDGDLDLLFQGALGAQQLIRNNVVSTGTLSFTNVSSLLPSGFGSSWSAAWGDYDGDRKVDVFIGQ